MFLLNCFSNFVFVVHLNCIIYLSIKESPPIITNYIITFYNRT